MKPELQLSDIGEDALVHRLTKLLPQDVTVIAGPGDDCAVVQRPHHELLLKTDAIVEGIHFTMATDPALIGRKALARAISDIAAMGGVPRHALATLVLPVTTEVHFVEAMYTGMSAVARQYGVSIVGGETSRGAQMVISIALTGEANLGKWVGRDGGKAGDALFVTGLLGGSIHGKHLTFEPRLAQAQWLLNQHLPHAMMDLSDGLAKDLPRLAAASGLEFIVNEASLPCTPGCTPSQAWGDGEDYELLFAIGGDASAALEKDWQSAFPDLPLTRIGKLVTSNQGQPPSFTAGGWDHFAKKAA